MDDKETSFLHPDQIRLNLRQMDLSAILKKGSRLKKTSTLKSHE